jgi:hypothetical protein
LPLPEIAGSNARLFDSCRRSAPNVGLMHSRLELPVFQIVFGSSLNCG